MLTDVRPPPASTSRSQRGESEIVKAAITRSRQGDGEAVHFLYARYASAVHAGVRDLVTGDSQAQDVAESVFGQLAELVQGYEPQEQSFVEWLVGVAREEHFLPVLRSQPRVPGGQ
jgi:DNA-directed RNA polymerase specialized sigma24 family protein